MNLWQRIKSPFGKKDFSFGSLEHGQFLSGFFGARSGVSVTLDTALQVSTVFDCLRVIGEGVAQVPLKVFQENKNGRGKVTARNHSLYPLLHRRPNSWQTSFEWREMMTWHSGLLGNGYNFINRVGSSGKIFELIPLDPTRVTVKQDANYTVTYEVIGKSGSSQTFPAESILHIRGPSWDGLVGMEALRLAREAVGLSIATESAHANLHRNGLNPSGMYSVDKSLTDTQYKQLRKWIDEEHAGVHNNSGKFMLLDNAAKWQSFTMSGVDAQHLETRRYQIEDVCRFFRVMPIMVGYSDKAATYASAEQMFLAHVVHTLSPWYERIEQRLDASLLTDKDREEGYYIKFVEEGLLRGALKDTAEYLTKLTTNGVMTRNEAREKLDLNPIDGLDEPLTPSNMTTDTAGGANGT